ncbi:Sds3-like-domain-containing protein [Phyllosticta capitalensis]|uniref:Sds3-like-domain-containing protein n=1 Tax=Phyllosticta capitalensis TaxID=121624 RepID=A0ABR1YDI2_9PEZI
MSAPRSRSRSKEAEMAPAKAPTPEPLESSPEPDEPRPGLDDGSSSLSEPESIEARGHIENDSEAETERIDDTPRRRAVDVTNVTERAGEPTEHAGESDDDVLEDAVLPEDNERKRKRSSSALSSLADGLDADQPSKRHSSYDKMEVDVETVEEPDKQADEDSGEGAAAQTTEAADEAVDEAIDEAADEAEAPSKKKGKKGKKAKKEDQTPAEEDDEEVEEERDRKHSALEVLNKIERQFLTFQKRRLEERLHLLSLELDQLQSPNSTHEEYQLMTQAVDQRRDEKIRQENVRLGLKKDILKKHFVAMRGSIHGQYIHDVGDVRQAFVNQCNQRITQLQRERRYWGTNETDYTIKYNDKRSQQAQHQQAYNLEVSILSGVAKFVGFPAAPNLNSARSTEVDHDLASMGMRPPPPRVVEATLTTAPVEQQPQPRAVTTTTFSTPAAQRNNMDAAPNGSASTIEMPYESPVLQLKHQAAMQTPSIRPNNVYEPGGFSPPPPPATTTTSAIKAEDAARATGLAVGGIFR